MTLEEQNELIEKNLPLVYYCVNKFYPTYKFDEDVISCGNIGLVNAARTFNISSNIKFSTYAVTCIKNEISTYFRRESKYKYELSLNNLVNDINSDDYLEFIDLIKVEDSYFSQIEDHDLILSFKKVLNEKEFTYFVLHHVAGLNQREIGDLFGISRAYVNFIIKNANKKLQGFIK